MKNHIGIIVTSHNQKKYIYENLDKLEYLCGKFPQIVVYLVDSGSTDLNFDEFENLRQRYSSFRIFRNRNLGSSGAKNFGAQKCTEPIMTFLDGDDIFLEERILIGLPLLDNGMSDIVIGNQKYFFEKEVDMSTVKIENINGENPQRSYLTSMILKRETFIQVGEFDTTLQIAGDLDWFLRAKRKNIKIDFVSNDFVLRRIHNENLSFKYTLSYQERNKVLLNHVKKLKQAND